LDIGAVGGVQRYRERRGIGDLDIRGCQRVGGAALAGEREFRNGNVIGPTDGADEVRTGHGEHVGARIVGGGGDGRRRYVADGDAVAGQVGGSAGGEVPAGGRGQVESRGVDRTGAV